MWISGKHIYYMCSQECNHELLQYLSYLSEDIVKIEEGTREQHINLNWKTARNSLLTKFKFQNYLPFYRYD